MTTLNHTLALVEPQNAKTRRLRWLSPLGALDSLDTADQLDAHDQLLLADKADLSLLRLVLCAALSTLLLALACSLGA